MKQGQINHLGTLNPMPFGFRETLMGLQKAI